MKALPERFPSGALAYLTATSKVEGPVRDAVAFFIHEQVKADGYTVAREFRTGRELDEQDRRDLAVLDRAGTAVLELEAKAMYSFNLLTPSRRREVLTGKRWHGGDVTRLQPAANDGVACFLLSLVTHLMAPVPPELYSVIKYADSRPGHNAVLNRYHGSPEAMYTAAKRWKEDLKVLGPVAYHVAHDLGEVYEVPICLDCYLVGPLPRRP